MRTSKDVEHWVDAQSDVTNKYLDDLSYRKQLKDKITDIWNYEKYSNFWKVSHLMSYCITQPKHSSRLQIVTFITKMMDCRTSQSYM